MWSNDEGIDLLAVDRDVACEFGFRAVLFFNRLLFTRLLDSGACPLEETPLVDPLPPTPHPKKKKDK